MNVTKTLVPAALVILFGSSWTMAGEHAMDPAAQTDESATAVPEFSEVDADRNGSVTISEAAVVPVLVEKFSTLDRDGDGALTEEEYAAIEPGASEDEEAGS